MTKQENTKSPKKKETQEKSTKKSVSLETLLGLATGEDGEKKPKKRPYFYVKDFGLIMPFWAVVSLEKSCELKQVGTRMVWYHEIIINRGIESSPNMPFGEHVLFWENEAVRDAKFDAIREAMKDHNYEFSEV